MDSMIPRRRIQLRAMFVLAPLVFANVAGFGTTGAVMNEGEKPARGWAIAIHGGAGESEWEHMDSATSSAYHDSLAKALSAGSAVLKRRGKAVDAVETAVKVLEDDPLFNAGRGSAFAADGTNEMDAALMNGATLAAGSVASVHFTRHPIALARAVMDHTP